MPEEKEKNGLFISSGDGGGLGAALLPVTSHAVVFFGIKNMVNGFRAGAVSQSRLADAVQNSMRSSSWENEKDSDVILLRGLVGCACLRLQGYEGAQALLPAGKVLSRS